MSSCPVCGYDPDLEEVEKRHMLIKLEAYTEGWSVRAKGVFDWLEAETFGDLTKFTTAEILRVPNCGRLTLKEIQFGLATMGLTFNEEVKR